MTGTADPGSFRDPAGFVFRRAGHLYRQVNKSYAPTLERLAESGFLRELQDAALLIGHEQLGVDAASTPEAFAVLRPEPVPFVSYPYEWCFGQLKDAALLTLDLQQRALANGFILRDGSAYNVQFIGGHAVFIDSLSFAIYREGQPWYAYGQFCEHFLAPLALMADRDVRVGALQRPMADGIPLDLASRLLSARTLLQPGLMLHVHAHATARRRYAGDATGQKSRTMSLAALRRLTGHLRSTIEGLRWRPEGTAWAEYETEHGYDAESAQSKADAVGELLARTHSRTAWDLGANTGVYSAVADRLGAHVVAIDSDPAAVERHYQRVREVSRTILPLLMDLRDPSPAHGWAHRERKSLMERGPTDVVLALALIHHLVLGAGVPLSSVADWFSALGRFCLVEFVPPDDPQVHRLVAGRTEMTHAYTEQEFQRAFESYFVVRERRTLGRSNRVLYLFERTRPADA
jgi:hypothetical protein